MTTTSSSNRLFQLLNAPALDELLVTAVITGEVQLVAQGSGPMDRTVAAVQGGNTVNILEFAPLDWWRTSATLVNAVEQGWLSIPTTQVVPSQTTPDVLPAVDDHFVIRWRETTAVQPPPVGLAFQQYVNGKLRLSEGGAPFRNVVDPIDVLPVAYGASVEIDFNPDLAGHRAVALTGNIAFTSANLAPGRRVRVLVTADASSRTLSFPAGWRFLGGSLPSALAANHVGMLSLTSFGSTDADVVALFSIDDTPPVSASQIISVKDTAYGALGNGVANDTTAVQAALTAAGNVYTSTGSRQAVYFPAGVYLVSKSTLGHFCLSIPSGVHVFGPGTIKMAAGQIAQVRLLSVEDARDVTIDDITLDGNKGNQTSDQTDPKKHAIFTRGSKHCLYRRVRVVNADGDAFYFGTNSGLDPRAHHCRVEDFWCDTIRRSPVTITSGAHHIEIIGGYCVNWSGDQSAALNIESDSDVLTSDNCVFEGVYVDEPAPEAPHTCLGVSLTSGHGCKIKNCRFPASVFVVRSNDVEVDSNLVDHPGIAQAGASGITVRYACARTRITRNKVIIRGPSDDPGLDVAGIFVVNTNDGIPTDTIIENNHILPYDGMYAIGTANLSGFTVIRGNVIDGNGEGRGIYAYSTSLAFNNLSVEGNRVRNTGTGEAGISFFTQTGATLGFHNLSVRNNVVVDDQEVPTCPQAFNFLATGLGNFNVPVFDGNEWTSNISATTGLGAWRTSGNYNGSGNTAGSFAGVIDPEGAITAGVGSLFQRHNGAAGTSIYVKESGTGSTGWVPVRREGVSTITYAASVALDFSAGLVPWRTLTLTGGVTFTTSNLATGRVLKVRIVCDGTPRSLAFPVGWIFVGGAAPSTIAAGKTATLTLESFGTADASVVASYSVQP